MAGESVIVTVDGEVNCVSSNMETFSPSSSSYSTEASPKMEILKNQIQNFQTSLENKAGEEGTNLVDQERSYKEYEKDPISTPSAMESSELSDKTELASSEDEMEQLTGASHILKELCRREEMKDSSTEATAKQPSKKLCLSSGLEKEEKDDANFSTDKVEEQGNFEHTKSCRRGSPTANAKKSQLPNPPKLVHDNVFPEIRGENPDFGN
jgi:hypothetical protein